MVGRYRRDDFPFKDRSWELAQILKRQRREILKISRRELASRAHVAESSIQAIEDGRTREPGLFTVISLVSRF
ncbi:helix-turn-helix domain-containing protein [Pseudoclavibacter helvolus]|uniref:helix-turn-helix domain-containing protein n=1 Tax=Pseudoclavibacter helvolus TaxID=255205 RepID=UPI003736B0EE